jgi:hypothetical protein
VPGSALGPGHPSGRRAINRPAYLPADNWPSSDVAKVRRATAITAAVAFPGGDCCRETGQRLRSSPRPALQPWAATVHRWGE